MAKVSKLTIKRQSGTNNTYFATWEFGTNTGSGGGSGGSGSGGGLVGGIGVGMLVGIKTHTNPAYYNGAPIPDWVKTDQWYVTRIGGRRAELGYNKSRTKYLGAGINVYHLFQVTGAYSAPVPASTATATTYAEPRNNYLSTLDHYEVKWLYDSGDGVWFESNKSDVKTTQATYNAPANAIGIRVTVTPVSKTYKVNDKDTHYWTGTAVSETWWLKYDPPIKPSAPTVTMDKFKMTATLSNITDGKADYIEFEVYDGKNKIHVATCEVILQQASMTTTVPGGGEYAVRCRAFNTFSSTVKYSEWSVFSAVQTTVPNPPEKILVCRAASETSVYLEWEPAKTADTYDVEYTDNKRYFDQSSATTVKTGIQNTKFEVTGLQTGKEYFFRVRSVNKKGQSLWSKHIVNVAIGKPPVAPTTWSSSTTVITGEPLNLYWVHNAEDKSLEKFAEVETIIGGIKETHTIKNIRPEDDKNKTSSYSIDTSTYAEGTKILWRVRTSGVTLAYGDWSVQRTVDVYARPTLTLSVTNVTGGVLDILESFPFYISALPGPKTQAPLGYHVTITANKAYSTIDTVGKTKFVNAGDEVYSKYFDIKEALTLELSANHVDLENGVDYTLNCVVSMNSGLTASATTEFTVKWTDISYEPDAEIAIDSNSSVAHITPYCLDLNGSPVTDVVLSVYRKNFDSTYTEIAKDIPNGFNTVVTDPHPALDYARYRIIAITKTTGTVSYYDLPAFPVGEKAIVIQWDEEWSNFNSTNEDLMENPPWVGSLLKLPYNIDVSDNHDKDVSFIKYMGRAYPVSYYGTNLEMKSSWNVDVPKEDTETIYALRRLALWNGNVYVREPSGSGYWASITVSFSQKHCDPVIPVSLDITRVTGGV